MFVQLLNLLERYNVYLHLCLLILSSHKIVQLIVYTEMQGQQNVLTR